MSDPIDPAAPSFDDRSVLEGCRDRMLDLLGELDANGYHTIAAHLSQVIDLLETELG